MSATGYSRSAVRMKNPYRFLALNVFLEAFRTIKCYYTNSGTEEEIDDGKKSIRWIRRMEGNYRILASSSEMPLHQFHQMCISRINEIKREAYDERFGVEKET